MLGNKMLKDWIVSISIAALGVLAPTKPLLIVVGVLIFMDTVTGVWAAYKRKERLSSNRFFRLPMKMLLYHIAILSGFLLQKYLLDDVMPVSKLVAAAIGTTEFYSMIENVQSITGKNIFEEVLSKLGRKPQ